MVLLSTTKLRCEERNSCFTTGKVRSTANCSERHLGLATCEHGPDHRALVDHGLCSQAGRHPSVRRMRDQMGI
jgi:hypothetical protein